MIPPYLSDVVALPCVMEFVRQYGVISEPVAPRSESDVHNGGAYSIDRCPTAKNHGVEEAREVRYRYYAVVGGAHPGVHATDNYAESVKRVVQGVRGAVVYGRSTGVTTFDDARRVIPEELSCAVGREETDKVIVWVRSAAGYVGRRGHLNDTSCLRDCAKWPRYFVADQV